MFEIMRIYQDSKELTARVYERIETTGDYRFMIKGYDIGDDVKCDIQELENKFNEIVQDYVLSINSKNLDILNIGKVQKYTFDLETLKLAFGIIENQIHINGLCDKLNRERIDVIENLLENVQIKRDKDLNKQLDIIESKMKKIYNDLVDAQSKLEKTETKQPTEKVCISEVVTGLTVVLGINIDMDKTSIFQVGKYIELAKKKNEQLTKE